ncbi:MAG: hypothetical protein ACKOCH_17420, partial [Bacteroidota bacterium]
HGGTVHAGFSAHQGKVLYQSLITAFSDTKRMVIPDWFRDNHSFCHISHLTPAHFSRYFA